MYNHHEFHDIEFQRRVINDTVKVDAAFFERTRSAGCSSTFASLLDFFFIGLVIYALVEVGNEDKYHFKRTCGDEGRNFFNWIIARFVLGFVQNVALALLTVLRNVSKQERMETSFLVRVAFASIAHVAYLIIGILFTHSLMDKPLCREILSEASFTKSPLLGIIGWLFVAFDSFFAFVLILLYLYIRSMTNM